MIAVRELTKVFKVPQKKPGLKESLKGLFHTEYIQKNALDCVSCEIFPGEIVGLVGANGAGKTTLVKILSGIVFPTAGEVSVLGFTPWDRKNEFKKQIALILGQKAQLWWDLPAADCFELLREIYEIPESLFKKNLEFLVDTLKVSSQLNTQIRRLSLGERMKMELIAALLHQPKVVFLDEPTIGLDFSSQKAVRKFLLEYRSQFKPAMILTSHYMEDIKSLCERVILIKDGKFIYDGALAKLAEESALRRIITVHLEGQVEKIDSRIVSNFGARIVSQELGVVKVEVDFMRVKDVAKVLFDQFEVQDISIEEVDIASSIEMRVMKSV
jgi:ABC-2 type transport system ATP-binding protein